MWTNRALATFGLLLACAICAFGLWSHDGRTLLIGAAALLVTLIAYGVTWLRPSS